MRGSIPSAGSGMGRGKCKPPPPLQKCICKPRRRRRRRRHGAAVCKVGKGGGLEVQLHNRARLDVEGGVGGEKKCNLRSSPLSWSEGGNRKVRGKGFFHVYAKGTPYYNVSAEMFGKLQRTWPADGGNHQEMEIQSLILFHVRTVAFEWCWQEDRKVTNCERQVQLASDGFYSICSPSIFSSVLQVLQLLLFLFLVSGAASANCFLCFLLKKRHI